MPHGQDLLDQRGSGSPSPAPSTPKPNANRVLACVLCQQRKVKCNRKFPCNNCIRMGAACVPATLNPRRRRRRFPERELLDRVRAYEALLRKHRVHFESLFQKETADGVLVPEGAVPDEQSRAQRTQQDDDDSDIQSDGEAPRATAASTALETGPNHIQLPHREQNYNDGASASSDDDEIRDQILRGLWQHQTGRTGSFVFQRSVALGAGPSPSLALLPSRHPGPAHIFLLWQTYLANVDPLLKITHTPTLQKRIAEAANTLAARHPIDATLEALMFAIYCVAVHSMDPADCQAAFGASKDALLAEYHPACEQALIHSGFLGASESASDRDRESLAAFLMYTMSLGHRCHPQETYAMLGVGTRRAKTMRLDQESANARRPPLEAELRRRLWWALALFDARVSELVQSPPVLDPTWDCRVPANANDSDLRAEMTGLAPSRKAQQNMRASEAVFVVVRSELGDAQRRMEHYLALSNPAIGAADCASLEAVETMTSDTYLQYCDPENGLHCMTVWSARGLIAKGRLIKYLSTASSAAAADDIDASALRDSALDDALQILQYDTLIITSPLTRCYRWLQHLYFPMPAYIMITQELARRISGDRAAQAWAAMHAHYEARCGMSDCSGDSSDRKTDHCMFQFRMFAGTVLRAWDACEERCRAAGEAQPPVPDMVVRIKADLAAETKSEAEASARAGGEIGGSAGL